VIYKFILLIIRPNGGWDKDFNRTLLSKMVYGLYGIEIDPGKSTVVPVQEVDKLMDINLFI
jgi:hypothetical protein